MLFVHSGNEYSAILRNGDVIKFEDEREALAVQKEYDGILEVLGKRLPEKSAECGARPHPAGRRGAVPYKQGKAKKVCIRIDNTSSKRTAEDVVPYKMGRQKEKALA